MSLGNKGRLSPVCSWLSVTCSTLYLCLGSVSANPVIWPSGKTGLNRLNDSGTNTSEQESFGLPIFRIDENRWFDVIIDFPDRPENASEVEEIRNREIQQGKSDKRYNIFPDPDDMMWSIRFRFHYRFN